MSKNLGGRINLEVDKQVRYLDNNGCVSDEVYLIDSPHTDFRARATLKNGDCVIPTHYDRILPLDAGGKAVAVLGDKAITITCPKCHKVQTAKTGQTHFTCCTTLEVFFMSNAIQQESQKFDLETLKNDFEVWVKDGKFNDTTELTTVQLVLLEGETPRKLSFNLYDGKLSTTGKGKAPNIEGFKRGDLTDDGKKFWYAVDATKYQQKLEKKGFRKL